MIEPVEQSTLKNAKCNEDFHLAISHRHSLAFYRHECNVFLHTSIAYASLFFGFSIPTLTACYISPSPTAAPTPTPFPYTVEIWANGVPFRLLITSFGSE